MISSACVAAQEPLCLGCRLRVQVERDRDQDQGVLRGENNRKSDINVDCHRGWADGISAQRASRKTSLRCTRRRPWSQALRVQSVTKATRWYRHRCPQCPLRFKAHRADVILIGEQVCDAYTEDTEVAVDAD